MQGLDVGFLQSKSVNFVRSNVQDQTATIPPGPYLILLIRGLFEKPDPKCNILEETKVCNITKACSFTTDYSSISL